MSSHCVRRNCTICAEPHSCRATLPEVLEKSGEKRTLFDRAISRLAGLSGGSDIIANLKGEALLSCEFWGKLIARVCEAKDEDVAICDAIRTHIRSIGTLKGPTASTAPATIFGRVVTRGQLADAFALANHFSSPEVALDHIKYMEGKHLALYRRAWGDFDLGRFVMWSTFDVAGAPPFQQLSPRTADHIRGILGLDPAETGRPLLLLQYVLSSADEARLPTVAEAYAGDVWHRYFKIANGIQIQLGYGITQPWPHLRASGVPEVVHRPVKGRLLETTPEEVR